MTKARLYAAADIPEYWIVNVRDDCIEVHRRPEAKLARYAEVTTVRAGARLALVALPDVPLAVDDLLPRRESA